jgi:hypothetical protein
MNKVDIRHQLIKNGFYLTKANVSKADITHLISKLRPVSTDKPLIRLGSEYDGGYLLPNDLDDIVACFSPGVSFCSDFEIAVSEIGIECYLADHSVDAPVFKNSRFNFIKKFIGNSIDDRFITLEDWIEDSKIPDGDLLLQMDIEGYEWETLLSIKPDTLRRFRIIVLELHGFENLFDRNSYLLYKTVLEKLLTDFSVVHIHPNNAFKPIEVTGIKIPPLLEMTLYRKGRAMEIGFCNDFPHPLDSKNIPSKPEVVLPQCWYKFCDC